MCHRSHTTHRRTRPPQPDASPASPRTTASPVPDRLPATWHETQPCRTCEPPQVSPPTLSAGSPARGPDLTRNTCSFPQQGVTVRPADRRLRHFDTEESRWHLTKAHTRRFALKVSFRAWGRASPSPDCTQNVPRQDRSFRKTQTGSQRPPTTAGAGRRRNRQQIRPDRWMRD